MAKRKRRRRLKKSVKIGFILIILLIVGGVYFYTNSKKYLFFKGLSKSYDEIIEIADSFTSKYMNYSKDSYYTKMNSSINVVTSEVDSNIKLNGDVYIDGDSNYFDLSVDANNSIYNLDLLTKENKLYFKVDDSKYYYINSNTTNLSMDDYYKALENMVSSFKENVKSSDLIKKNTTVLIDGEKLNVKKLTLSINDELYEKVFKSFYKEIGLGEEEIMTNFDLSIYLYKSNPVQIDLSNDSYTISFISYDNYLEFNFVTLDSMSHIKFKDGKIDLLIDGICIGTGKYNDQSFKIDFTDLNNNSIGNISYSINKNNNKYINKMSFDLDLSEVDIKLDLSNEITPSKDIPNINVNNSIIVDNITNQDEETISKLLDTINIIFAF